MAVIDSRLKNGTLTFTVDAVVRSFACQAKNVTIVPPDQPSGNDDEAVLCGEVLPPDGSDSGSSWRIQINTIQDFDAPEGVQRFLIQNRGKLAAVTWTPNPNGFSASGEVTVWPGNIGGDVKPRLESQLEMRFSAEPTWGWPAATTPAAWQSETAYSVGDEVSLTGGEVLTVTVAGTSDLTEPTPPAVGATVVDGTVTWERVS